MSETIAAIVFFSIIPIGLLLFFLATNKLKSKDQEIIDFLASKGKKAKLEEGSLTVFMAGFQFSIRLISPRPITPILVPSMRFVESIVVFNEPLSLEPAEQEKLIKKLKLTFDAKTVEIINNCDCKMSFKEVNLYTKNKIFELIEFFSKENFFTKN